MLSKDTFLNPPAAYRPIPFWFWNSKLRKPEIIRQIRDFHDKGLGGFFIHARFGLETPYMSDEWLDCIRQAVDTAGELGMEVWLYDENAFPSGVGDLKVSSVPEYRPKFIDLEETDGKTPDGEVLLSLPIGGRTAHFVKRTVEDPNDVVFGVDYLSPEAMSRFFEITLEPYERTLGDHFGKTIKGIFTDEPVLLPWHHNINWYGRLEDTKVVVWDDLIAVELKKHHGLDLKDFLPHLFYDIDANTPDRRKKFWRTVSNLFVRAFFEPYSRWCEEHNLKLTGHVLFEEGLILNTDFQSDIIENLKRMHIPGTDHLGACTEVAYGGFSNTPKMKTNIQGEKLVTSISHIYGKEACISETFGCADWGLTPRQMKWMLDWQYTLGVNMFCPHAVFYSIEGFRKSDAPPSQNHMTFWKDHKLFADYAGRLSYILRQGRHGARVAVEYPLEKFWGLHRVGNLSEDERILSDQFDEVCSTLVSKQIDYDIIPSSELRQDRVVDGRLLVSDECYEHLIAFRSSPVTGIPVTVIGPDEGISEVEWTTLPTSVSVSSPTRSIQCIERICGSQRAFFFANCSGEVVEVDISLDAQGLVERWDLETGLTGEAAGIFDVDGKTGIRTYFPPYGSALYIVDTARKGSGRHNWTAGKRRTMAELTSWEFEILDPNALPLSQLEMQMKTHGSGTDYIYSTTVEADFLPEGTRLLLDDVEYRWSLMGGMDIAVLVNGFEFRDFEPWEIDPHIKTVDITKALKSGNNAISIVIRHSAWSGQPLSLNSIPVLLGNFTVVSAEAPYKIGKPVTRTAPGSWTESGYPFFSGTTAYKSAFDLPAVESGARIFVEANDIADTVNFVINGEEVCSRLWQPWCAEITGFIKPGMNEIEIRVTNSMQNMLERSPRPSGLLGNVKVTVEI